MDVTSQYQQIIIHRAANKGESLILVLRNIRLVCMVIKVVRKKDADGGNSQKSDSTLACATTKLKSKVVRMCVVLVKVKFSNSKKEFRTHAILNCCHQGASISTDLARKIKTGVQTTIKIKKVSKSSEKKDVD